MSLEREGGGGRVGGKGREGGTDGGGGREGGRGGRGGEGREDQSRHVLRNNASRCVHRTTMVRITSDVTWTQ